MTFTLDPSSVDKFNELLQKISPENRPDRVAIVVPTAGSPVTMYCLPDEKEGLEGAFKIYTEALQRLTPNP